MNYNIPTIKSISVLCHGKKTVSTQVLLFVREMRKRYRKKKIGSIEPPPSSVRMGRDPCGRYLGNTGRNSSAVSQTKYIFGTWFVRGE